MSLVDLGKQLLDAAKNGRTEEVRTLMSNGAPFTTDWLGTSPLHFAALSGHVGTAEVLLRAGISRDARTKVDRTPLHVSSQEGHTDIVDLLIKNGADVEAKDMLKMTPLHWAVEKGHFAVIELLLGHGAEICCENKFDKTPVDIAVTNGRQDLAEVLQLSRMQQQTMVEIAPDQTVIEEVTTTSGNYTTQQILEVGSDQTVIEEVTTTEPMVEEYPESEIITTDSPVRGIKTEKGILEDGEVFTSIGGDTEQNSTAVLSTLAALAEATGPLNAANATSTTAAEALNWLETQGITMMSSDASTIVSSTLGESGRTLTLTEAGQLALNFVKHHEDEPESTSEVTEEVVTDDDGTQKVITIVTEQGQLATSTEGAPMIVKLASMPAGDIHADTGEPPMKNIKVEKAEMMMTSTEGASGADEEVEQQPELEEDGEVDVTLRQQLEEVQKQAEQYKNQLQQKQQEADGYKKQLNQMKTPNS